MIKQIIFDCGGVLVEMKFRDMMLEISSSEQVTDYFMNNIWRSGSPWLRYDKGEIGNSEILAELKAFMPEEYHCYLEEFVRRWPDALPPMDGMADIIDALHQNGCHCYLLSNFAERFEAMPSRVPALRKLDGAVVSYRVHMLKPDPAIYLHTLDTFGIKAEETLFIDDVAANIEGAEAVGIRAHLFTTPTELTEYLKSHGILPNI